MANRILNQALCIEKQVVKVFGKLVIGAAGAVTSYAGMGISSIVKNVGAGNYTVTLEDGFDKFLMFSGMMNSDAVGGSTVGSIEVSTTQADLQTDFKAKSFDVQLLDYAGAAGNAVATSVMYFEITARRSSVGPA